MRLLLLVLLAACGGSTPALLPDGASCQLDSDCESGACGVSGRTDMPAGPRCQPRFK